MNKKTVGLSLSVIALAVAAALPTVGFAYRGDASVQGPNCTPERHAAMEQAFESNDYSAWKETMGDRGRVSQLINAGNFSRFAEAHRLSEAGKIEEAKQIRTELGLGQHQGEGRKIGR